jgi:hypothetical protein
VRTGLGGTEEDASSVVLAARDGGDSHEQVRVDLALAVHTGETVYEPRQNEFARDVYDAVAFRDGDFPARTYSDDLAGVEQDSRVRQITGGVAEVRDVDPGAPCQGDVGLLGGERCGQGEAKSDR